MRNYWLKIALGTLAVFIAGMVIVTMIRKGRTAVHEVVDGSGPLSIPLPSMVPFNLDNERLGSLRHLTVYRSSPKVPSRFAVSVQLADSASAARLSSCILYIASLDKVDEHTTFRCGSVSDTAGLDLIPFGAVTLRGSSDSFPLLLPRKAVLDLKGIHPVSRDSAADAAADAANGAADQAQVTGDSIREIWRARADSIRAAAEAARAARP